METDTEQDLTDIREQVEQLDSNQEDLIQIMKTLREKIVALASESDNSSGDDAAEKVAGHVSDVEKRLRQHKLSEDKKLSEIRSKLDNMSEELEHIEADNEKEVAITRMGTDIDAVWNEVEGLEDNQDDLSQLLHHVDEELSAFEEQPQIAEIRELMGELDTQAEELATTIQGIEQMFHNIGALREETEEIIESTTVEQADLEQRMNALSDQVSRLAIEEKVDRSQLEAELETLRDQAEDVSWIEERLEHLAMEEAVDSTSLQTEIEEIKETLADRSEIHSIQRQLDVGVAQELMMLEHKLSGLNEELGELVSREHQDTKDIEAVRNKLEDLQDIIGNVQKIEDAYTELGHLKERVSNHEAAEESDLEGLGNQFDSLEDRFNEDVSPLKKQQQKLVKQVDTLKKKAKKNEDLAEEVAALEQDMNELSELVIEVLGN